MNYNLSNAQVNQDVRQPSFDRSRLKSRIVHLGFGAFHRAHQALYTSECLDKSGSDWGICEISLFGTALIEQLRKQDHLFCVLEKDADKPIAKICGSVVESLHPKLDGTQAVLNKLAHPDTAIVSLTITEKGYCADLSTGRLDKNNPSIQVDLQNREQPVTAIGYVVEALRMRRATNAQGFTVMSCDNIQGNGKVTKQVMLDYASELDSELSDWIAANVSFPSTMVDRIVPAVTDQSFAELKTYVGVDDPCAVVCEPFRQWVIEDDFVNGRPNWDEIGAEFVKDVTPFEEMKLRLLNGSHSFLAYLGYLGGHKYIYQTMADEVYRSAAYLLMTQEQAVTLRLPDSVNPVVYADLLISRFSNSAIAHETWQIATDGSQKLPQRFCESLRFHLKNGSPTPLLILGLAGWMVYVGEIDEYGKAIDVRDPMLDLIRITLADKKTPKQVVNSLLGMEQIFATDLRRNESFVSQLIMAYQQVKELGARNAIIAILNSQLN